METKFDVIIVGGGVVGSAVARELSRYRLSICVLEKELDVCNGTSGRNTGLLHSGILHEKGTLRAVCSMEGNAEFDQVAAELDVPFRRCGKLIVGFGDERERLEKLYRRGLDNGIPGLRMIERDELKACVEHSRSAYSVRADNSFPEVFAGEIAVRDDDFVAVTHFAQNFNKLGAYYF